jgi:hypothetical protein
MIRLKLAGDPPVYMLGVTDLNVERLTKGEPIKVDLRELGGRDVVMVFHGTDASELREQLAAILSPEQLAVVSAGLDQLEAAERELREPG